MLLSLPWLVTQLEISEADALLLYNPTTSEWDIHHLRTNCGISEYPCLLYKLIRSIRNSFPDSKCPQLIEEIERINNKSSTAIITLDDHLSEVPICRPLIPKIPVTKKATPIVIKQEVSRETSESKKRPNMKEWPTDFTVEEISNGFQFIHQGQMERRKLEVLFSEAFGGARFVKSTFSKIRSIYEHADQDLKEEYLAHGQAKEGLWRYFRKDLQCYRVKGSNQSDTRTSSKRSFGQSYCKSDSENSLPDPSEIIQNFKKQRLSQKRAISEDSDFDSDVRIIEDSPPAQSQVVKVERDAGEKIIYIIDSD